MVCFATGYNPIRKEKYATPNVCWAISLDHMNMGSIMKRTLFSMLPKGFKFYKMENRIVLPKPWQSEIVLKSADSGREKFQGEGLTAAWFDEEPIGTEGHEIFKEVFARRKPGVDLNIFMTFTPLQGLSWSYRVLWNPKSEERLKNVETFSFDLHDCSIEKGGFLLPKEIDSIESGYNEWERQARVHGQYTIMGGSPFFSPKLIQEALNRTEMGKKFKIRMKLGALPTITSIGLDENTSGELTIFRPPLKGHKYILGVDVGGGVGKDATVGSVWDTEDLVQTAEWYSRNVDPQDFGANHLPALGMFYNQAEIVVENNGEHGGTVVNQLRGKYRRVYMRQDWDSVTKRIIPKYGFTTNTRTRGIVLDTLSRCLRESTWLPASGLLEEMATFVVNEDNKAEAMSGCNDDRVFAAGIALTVLLENPVPKVDYSTCKITYQRSSDDWMGY